MSEEDQDSKTEQPSAKKLDSAREEGHVALSQEIKTAAALFGITVVVWLIAPPVMARVKSYLAHFFEQSHAIRVGDEAALMSVVSDLALRVGLLMAVPLLFMLAVGVAASVAQTGWLVTPKRLLPDLNKMNPLTGFARLFSLSNLVEMGKSIAKLLVVGGFFYFVLKPRIKELPQLPSMEMAGILDYLHQILLRLLFAVLAIEVVIAGADWLYQRFAFMKKQRMTKQEVKDEHKQIEGDPLIKSRLRSLRVQRARQRMMAAVPKADVVVTNPTHYACALKYEAETMNAPVLVAKGKNLVALRIREIAEESDVPIVENPPLARALHASVELDREIPPEHYKAVAEVISYVMRLKGQLRR
jgi:flagellar biosynthesis protein FlhB